MTYQQPFFQAGGSLPSDIPSYIVRKADEEFYEYLQRGEFCFVLTSRQMGKSSLKVRTMERLTKEDWSCVNVDLTAFGTTDFQSEQWYFSFLLEIADTLNLEDQFEEWWDSKQKLTPVARMTLFWEDIILKLTYGTVAIFIDEVDTMLSLDKEKFSTDDFFAAIRAVYNSRGNNPQFKRLNFCIFGVAAPSDLMYDHERTPFNIGVPVRLLNFTREEASILIKGLDVSEEIATQIFERILYWTGGQPYLTQKVFQHISLNDRSEKELAQLTLEASVGYVDQLIEELFFHGNSIASETHFSNIQTRILFNDRYNLKMLEIYRMLLNNEKVWANNKNPEQLYIKLAGIVREEEGILVINNPIYHRVFDHDWLSSAYAGIKRPFAVDLQRWLNTERSSELLLAGPLLLEAEKWAEQRDDLTNQERDFLEASKIAAVEAAQEAIRQEQNERQQKRIRAALRGLTALAIVAICSAIFAIYFAISNKRTSQALQQQNEKLTTLTSTLVDNILELTKGDFQKVQNNYESLLFQGDQQMNDYEYATAALSFDQAKLLLDSNAVSFKKRINENITLIDKYTEDDSFELINQLKSIEDSLTTFIQHSMLEIDSLKNLLTEVSNINDEVISLINEGKFLQEKDNRYIVAAEAKFIQALKLDPNNSEARTHLAEVRARKDIAYSRFIEAGDNFFKAESYNYALEQYKYARRIRNTRSLRDKITACEARITN